RLEQTVVAVVLRDGAGEHDVRLADRDLRVVALDETGARAQDAAVGIGTVALAASCARQRPPAYLRRLRLLLPLFGRGRFSGGLPRLREPLRRSVEAGAPLFLARKPGRQQPSPGRLLLRSERVLTSVRGLRLRQQPPRLLSELALVDDPILVGVRADPGAVDRDEPHPRQPRLGTERKHATEEADQRLRVTATEARDRHVVRLQAAGGDAEG